MEQNFAKTDDGVFPKLFKRYTVEELATIPLEDTFHPKIILEQDNGVGSEVWTIKPNLCRLTGYDFIGKSDQGRGGGYVLWVRGSWVSGL